MGAGISVTFPIIELSPNKTQIFFLTFLSESKGLIIYIYKPKI